MPPIYIAAYVYNNMPRGDPDLPEPEFPDDGVEVEDEAVPEAEVEEEIPPAPARMPEFYAYFKDIIESKEVPEEAQNLMWPLFNRDNKLGKLSSADEYLIHIGLSMYETALVQLKRRTERRLTWQDFVHMLGAKATEPAVLSRGRGGFERTMQNAQITASISAGKMDVKEGGVISQMFANVKRAFGGGD